MDIINQIREHALNNFASSPIEYTDEEVNKIINANCECLHCGKSIFNLYDFPNLDDDDYDVLCEDCYDELYLETCECCEETYEPREESIKYFALTPNQISNFGLEMKAGIYKVKNNPFHYGDVVFGFSGIYEEDVELIRECNLDSMLTAIHNTKHELECADICNSCAEKYGRLIPLARLSIKYCDKFTRIHHNINVKGIVERGF